MESATALTLAQLVVMTLLTGWLATGVNDNLRLPQLNEPLTAEVFGLDRMRANYPALYAIMAHRALHNPALMRGLFRLVVASELLVCMALAAGTLGLGLSLCGWVDPGTARALCLLAVAGFTAIWGGFLIVGNHFGYWMCHEGAQVTHFHLMLSGLGTLILLAQ